METAVLGSLPSGLADEHRAGLRPAGAAERLPAQLMNACRPAALGWSAALDLAACAREHRFAAGQPVLDRGAKAGSLWFVASGSVALGRRACPGTLQQRRAVEAGQWLDVASAMLGAGHLEDADAQSEALVVELPLGDVQHCALSHTSVMPALAAAMAVEMAALIEGTRDLMTKDVLGRCAGWLLEHAELERDEQGRLAGSLRLKQRKRALAQQLGTTAETFSRTLRQLSRMGLVEVKGYDLRLPDVQGLRQLAQDGH